MNFKYDLQTLNLGFKKHMEETEDILKTALDEKDEYFVRLMRMLQFINLDYDILCEAMDNDRKFIETFDEKFEKTANELKEQTEKLSEFFNQTIPTPTDKLSEIVKMYNSFDEQTKNSSFYFICGVFQNKNQMDENYFKNLKTRFLNIEYEAKKKKEKTKKSSNKQALKS